MAESLFPAANQNRIYCFREEGGGQFGRDAPNFWFFFCQELRSTCNSLQYDPVNSTMCKTCQSV